jgi:hypothetical protein
VDSTERWSRSGPEKGDEIADRKVESTAMVRRVVVLSLLLLFFSVPLTLEDFASGEPGKAGIPARVLSLVVASVLALQAVGLYWLGQRQRWGLFVQAGVGLFWPVASGVAQLPTIFSGVPCRSGFISVFFVGGIIVIGILLLGFSVSAVRSGRNRTLQ